MRAANGKIAKFSAILVTIVVFWLGKHLALRVFYHDPFLAEALLYAAALFSLTLAIFVPAPISSSYRILSGGLGIILGLAAVQGYLGYAIVEVENEDFAKRFFIFGPTIAIALGALAYWRPVLLIGCALYSFLERLLVPKLTGLPISNTDIFPVFEAGLLIGVGSLVVFIIHKAKIDIDQAALERLLWAATLGLHFSNYFYSGIAKVALPGPWLTWVFENDSLDLAILSAWYDGRWILSSHPALTSWIVSSISPLTVPANAAILLIQLAAPLAVLRVLWLRYTTIAFDFMHVAIFLAAGLLFWKWILLNVVFLTSTARLKKYEYTNDIKGVAFICTVGAVFFAQTAHLGWYNTRAISSRIIIANTEDGRRLRVPTAFFLNQSYSISHGLFDVGDGHFPTSPMGETRDYKVHQRAKDCSLDSLPNIPSYHTARSERPDQSVQFIRAYHRYFLRLQSDGKYNYVAHPFHHFSNWNDYPEFLALDKRKVISYTLIGRSHCLSLEGGRLMSLPHHETRINIPVS